MKGPCATLCSDSIAQDGAAQTVNSTAPIHRSNRKGPVDPSVSQSVRDRLLRRTRRTGEDHQVVLTRFALERLLYRLGQLPEGDDFTLKGAFAFLVWEGTLGRQTRDLDLLGHGPPSADRLQNILVRACQADVPEDGVEYDAETLEIASIREGNVYDGLRAELISHIGSARLPLQVDVGFGDAVVPPAERKVFPGLLDFPEPELKTYPPETVVAEKVHGMVRFGRANTRMKDFYDIWRISQTVRLEGEDLTDALRATFERRQADFPEETPVALTDTFAGADRKKRQWQAFARQVEEEIALDVLIEELRTFLGPLLQVARETSPTEKSLGKRPLGEWSAGGPWTGR